MAIDSRLLVQCRQHHRHGDTRRHRLGFLVPRLVRLALYRLRARLHGDTDDLGPAEWDFWKEAHHDAFLSRLWSRPVNYVSEAPPPSPPHPLCTY